MSTARFSSSGVSIPPTPMQTPGGRPPGDKQMYDNVDPPPCISPPAERPLHPSPGCRPPMQTLLKCRPYGCRPPQPCEQTDRCNNITLPQTKIKITHEQLQILSKISWTFHGSRIALIIIRTTSIDQMPTRPFYWFCPRKSCALHFFYRDKVK